MSVTTLRDARLDVRPASSGDAARLGRRYTARERADLLCDAGTFVEIQPARRARSSANGRASRDGDGVVVGWGAVGGRPVAVVAHDFSNLGGSIGAAFAAKVTRIQRLAIERRFPIVYLNDSGGARIHEGIEALNGCGEIMALNVAARAVVPQISAILGPCAGAAAYSPALTDWTIMSRENGRMFLTGPEVVRAATGEHVDPAELGGSEVHLRHSGVAHLEGTDDRDVLAMIRRLLGYLPSSAGGPLPERVAAPPSPARAAALPHVVPAGPRAAFDMRAVLAGILDAGVLLELMPASAPSLITGLARLDGLPVGVVATQPARRGGILDSASAVKGARFVEFCGRFGLPILTFVDVPGFLPGAAEERRGVITHGASLVAAYVGARVPKLTLIVRKAYGGAYIALGSRSLGADLTWSWPDAEIAVMGPEAAIGLLHRREIAAAAEPEALRESLVGRYRAEVTSPRTAAALGLVDEIIDPDITRQRMIAGLRLLVRGDEAAEAPVRLRNVHSARNDEARSLGKG